jgi:hypothetical protein
MPGARSSTTATGCHLPLIKHPNIHSIADTQSVSQGPDIPTRSTPKASRRDDRKRCWPVLKRPAVHNAVHRVCISVDTCVEWGVENLWINPGRTDITADTSSTTPHIWCGEQFARRVGPGYCAGRVGFRPYFRRVTGWLRGPFGKAAQIVRQPIRRGPRSKEPLGVPIAPVNPAASEHGGRRI